MDLSLVGNPAKNLSSQAFERLRADIVAGVLRPLERLRIQALSERYAVGATAVREALSRLVTDGLVVLEENRGFSVSPVSGEDLMDLVQVRIDVERAALRRSISGGDLRWESHLLGAFHRLAKLPPVTPETVADASRAHREFHEALLGGHRSAWSQRVRALLYDQSERYRSLAAFSTLSGRREASKEHEALLDATMARDADAACELLEAHFRETARITYAATFGVDGVIAPVTKTSKGKR